MAHVSPLCVSDPIQTSALDTLPHGRGTIPGVISEVQSYLQRFRSPSRSPPAMMALAPFIFLVDAHSI